MAVYMDVPEAKKSNNHATLQSFPILFQGLPQLYYRGSLQTSNLLKQIINIPVLK